MVKEKINSMKLSPLIDFKEGSLRYYCEIVKNHKVYQIFKLFIILIFFIRVSVIYTGFKLELRKKIYKDLLLFALSSFLTFILETLGKRSKLKAVVWAFHIIYFMYCGFAAAVFLSHSHLDFIN